MSIADSAKDATSRITEGAKLASERLADGARVAGDAVSDTAKTAGKRVQSGYVTALELLLTGIKLIPSVNGALGLVGLQRKRSNVVSSALSFGAGVAFGAGAGLLFAPKSGAETRAALRGYFSGSKVENLANNAVDKVESVAKKVSDTVEHAKEEAKSDIKEAKTHAKNGSRAVS